MSVDSLFTDTWSTEIEKAAMDLKGPILVIGASGFIGARLFLSLIKRRPDVFAGCRSPHANWRLGQLPKGTGNSQIVTIDVTNSTDLTEQIQRLKPRTIFNLSAYGAYERQNDPRQIHDVNYFGTLNLILALREVGCEAFVQAGTSSEYGLNCSGPTESATLKPNSHYAVAKCGAGQLVHFYGKIHAFPAVNLRLYSIYGPYEDHDRLIPRLVEAGRRGSYPALAAPQISRDFVYVDDCTAAFVKAATTVCRTHPGQSINVCTGQKTTLQQAALAAQTEFNISPEPVFGSMANRKWDLDDWFGNPTLAQEIMGWTATTPFAQGLKLTRAWMDVADAQLGRAAPVATRRKLAAVIACFRDNLAIPIMYERLTKVFKSLDVDYEIIFVNDGSPADDQSVIEGLCREDYHVLGISHSRNFGSQAAFLSGMSASNADAMILLDGDLQDPPEVIAEFHKKWIEGYDVVYGVRVRREAVWYMQILYKAFYRFFRMMAEVEIPLHAGDFSLIDRRVATKVLDFPERDIFLRGLRAWVGFRQVGVPYVRPERMFGRTTNNFRKNIWWAKKAIFSFSQRPLNYIQTLGVGMFLVSFILAAVYGVLKVMYPDDAPPGVTTIIVFVLAIGGLQMFAVSILGDYLGKVLEEVKRRPKWIRARIFAGQSIYESDAAIEDYVEARKAKQKK